MQLYNESLKKRFEERIIIQLVRKLQKTLTYYHQTLKLKYCSRSSLPKVLLNKAVQKKKKQYARKKICGGGQNLKLVVS